MVASHGRTARAQEAPDPRRDRRRGDGALPRARASKTVTVAEVARAADVSEKTVFNHFPTKEDLVFARGDDRLRASAPRRSATRVPGVPLSRLFEDRDDGVPRADSRRATSSGMLAVLRLVRNSPSLRDRLLLRLGARGGGARRRGHRGRGRPRRRGRRALAGVGAPDHLPRGDRPAPRGRRSGRGRRGPARPGARGLRAAGPSGWQATRADVPARPSPATRTCSTSCSRCCPAACTTTTPVRRVLGGAVLGGGPGGDRRRRCDEVPADWKLRQMSAGVVIGPVGIRSPFDRASDAEIDVVIERRGSAFGCGSHPTTQMCVALMLQLEPGGGGRRPRLRRRDAGDRRGETGLLAGRRRRPRAGGDRGRASRTRRATASTRSSRSPISPSTRAAGAAAAGQRAAAGARARGRFARRRRCST